MANILHIGTEDVKCFLCNKNFNSGDKSFLIFMERIQNDGSFDCPLSQILSAALDFEVDETTTHSTLLCSICNLIVLAFEKLEKQLFAMRSRIINDYNRTKEQLEKLANAPKNSDKSLDKASTVEFLEETDDDILYLKTEPGSVVAADKLVDIKSLKQNAPSEAVGGMFDAFGEQHVYEESLSSRDLSAEIVVEEHEEGFEEKFIPGTHVLSEALSENNDVSEIVLEPPQTSSYDVNEAIHFSNIAFQHYETLLEHFGPHEPVVNCFTCELCLKSFATKYSLQTHQKTHGDRVRPFKCDECHKQFLTEPTLQRHKKKHTNDRPFVCRICQKAFATQHNLNAHGITHSGVKPYNCQTCGKSFARKAEMTDHERIHTGIRPFKCDLCESSFTQRSNLIAHKRTTHFNEKMHKCDLCERSFKRRRLLEYHKNAVHTGERPYKCDKCPSSFVYKEHLRKHVLIHTGEKPYACEVCNKRFNSRDNRNAHRFVHSDKKPYECVVCGAGFMRKPLLLAHMKHSEHMNDTFIVNQPQINGGVLQTTTVMVSSIEESADEPQEMIIDHLEEGSQSFEISEVITDCVETEEGDSIEVFKPMVKIDDLVVN